MATASDSPVIGRLSHFGFDLKKPNRTGWLLKQGGNHKAFKSRFFVLYKGFLVYYTSEEKFRQDVSRQTLTNRIHAIKLKKAEVHTAKYPPKGCHFGFTIYAPDPVNKRNGYLFNAQDKQDRKEWILALREATGTPHKPRKGSELELELEEERAVVASKEKDPSPSKIVESQQSIPEEKESSNKGESKPKEQSNGDDDNNEVVTSIERQDTSNDIQVAVISMSAASDDEEDPVVGEGGRAEEGQLLVDKGDVDSEEEKGPEPEASPTPLHKGVSPLVGDADIELARGKSPLPVVQDSDSSDESDDVPTEEVIQPPPENLGPPGIIISVDHVSDSPSDSPSEPSSEPPSEPSSEPSSEPQSGEGEEKKENGTVPTEDKEKNGDTNGDVPTPDDTQEEGSLAPPSGSLKKKRTSIAFNGKQGWLFKRGGKHQSWKQRWFVLSPGTFTYYKKKGDTKDLGEVKLKDMKIFYPGQGQREQAFQFTVHTESSWNKRKDYVIAAKDETDLKDWVDAFKLAAQRNA